MATDEAKVCDYSKIKLADLEIGQRIGKGQFSVVYKARCKLNNQAVALKKVQLLEMTDSKARADCMKEIQLLQVTSKLLPNAVTLTEFLRIWQQLNHPNVVCYLASFVENNELQIVLELADAGDLAQLLRHCQRQNRLLVERTIWRYFIQLCSALEHMHSKRVMHRGILPL
jgi:serine/threonine protein kinase